MPANNSQVKGCLPKCGWLVVVVSFGLLGPMLVPYSQAQFTYVTNAGAITITGYTGASNLVAIPSIVNSRPVTRIGDSAFQSKSSLVSITIPGSVTNIGTSAFLFCTSLTNVTMSPGLISIGDLNFWQFLAQLAPVNGRFGDRQNTPW